MFVFICLLLWY